MRKLFFVGMLLASLFCGASVVLAKEDGTEDCDAVVIERVLAQVRGVLANTEFLTEVKPTLSDVKKIVEEITAENFRRQEEFFAEEKSK